MLRLKNLLNLLAYAASALAVVPVFLYLERPVQAFWPAALLAGMICDRLAYYPLRRTPAAVISCLFFLLYAVNISRDQLVHSVVHILVLLLAIRLLTEKSGRDYLQIFVLAVVVLAGSTLLDLSPLFLATLILQVFAVTVGLVLLTFHASDPGLCFERPELRRILLAAGVLPVGSLVLMLGFFLILPRTSHPLWNFLNPAPAAAAAPGLSDRVQPGAFANPGESGAIVFRADGEELPVEERYWRGTVLNTVEGTAWVRRPPPGAERSRVIGGRLLRQTIYPEPNGGRALLAVDPPLQIDGLRNQGDVDQIFVARFPIDRRLRYETATRVGGELQASGATDRAFYLQLPATVSSRLRQVGKRIAADGRTARERIILLQEFFLAQKLSYARTDVPGPDATVDDFLFGKKRGYCEFFASSFALLLRLADVPARLVGGYHGGEYNALGGYYLVREDAAHVWVEALVDGRWVRIDPTLLAQNAGSVTRPRFGPWQQLVDSLDYYWTQAVITFDLGSQLRLLQHASGRVRELQVRRPQVSFWIVAAGLAGASVAAVCLRGRRREEERLVQAFRQRVAERHRLPTTASMGLLELAAATGDPECREFAAIYSGAIYRDRSLTAAERRRLRQLLRHI